MISIARKNLWHDKIRLVVTLIGVTFAVVLVFVQLGFYFGFMDNVALYIVKADADIWVVDENLKNIEYTLPFREDKIKQVRATKGVASAENVISGYFYMKFKDGSRELVKVVGFDPISGIGGPWAMKQGSIQDLKYTDAVIMDETYFRKFKDLKIGDNLELIDSKVKLAGICKGAESFSGAPFIFTSFNTIQNIFSYNREKTTYILAKVLSGYNIKDVVKRLSHIKHVSVYAKDDLTFRTKLYWTLNMGIGIAFLGMALMAVIIGVVIVSQTIYASTVEHLREFGTLKAIGATNWDICKIIFEQALISACGGYIFGVIFALAFSKFSKAAGITMSIGLGMSIGIFFLTLIMCLSASFISIKKVMKLDPAVVFRA